MANKIIAGGPPPADVNSFPPGTLFWQLEQDTVDPRKITLTAWSEKLPNQIDWGDNSYSNPNAWTTAPTGEGLNGKTVVTHTYTGRVGTIYRWFIEAGGVRDHGTVETGSLAVVDDVTREGVKRPPEDNQTQIYRERAKLSQSIQKQMGAMPDRRGGMVNR